MTRAVGAEIKRLRKERGWTQEELADRLRKLGVDFSVSAVVNIEAHRRAGIALHELVALAAVLGVAPLALAFPDRRAEVELLPDRPADVTSAAAWFSGMYLPPSVMVDAEDPDAARSRYQASGRGLDLLREHEAYARDLLTIARLRDRDTSALYRRRVATLQGLRDRMAREGWPLPVLPCTWDDPA